MKKKIIMGLFVLAAVIGMGFAAGKKTVQKITYKCSECGTEISTEGKCSSCKAKEWAAAAKRYDEATKYCNDKTNNNEDYASCMNQWDY